MSETAVPPKDVVYYQRDVAVNNGHEFMVRMSKVQFPNLNLPEDLQYAGNGEGDSLYFGGVEKLKINHSVEMTVADDDGKETFEFTKYRVICSLVDEKPVMIDLKESNDPDEVIPVRVVTKSKEDKAKLIACHQTRILKDGVYYNVTAVSTSTTPRFKGKLVIPKVKKWGAARFREELKKEKPDLLSKETDLDIFNEKSETGKLVPSGMITILFKTGDPVHEFELASTPYVVQEFIEEPVKCYRCRQYGHVSYRCTGISTCTKCGEPSHTSDDEKCIGLSCVNCFGKDHGSLTKDCPVRDLMLRVDKYSRTHDVDRLELLRFARDVTSQYFNDLNSALDEESKLLVERKWKNTFTTEAERMSRIASAARKQQKSEKRNSVAAKIAALPAARSLLDTICLKLSEPFKKLWSSNDQPAMRRSASAGSLNSRPRPRQKFGSQNNLSEPVASNQSLIDARRTIAESLAGKKQSVAPITSRSSSQSSLNTVMEIDEDNIVPKGTGLSSGEQRLSSGEHHDGFKVPDLPRDDDSFESSEDVSENDGPSSIELDVTRKRVALTDTASDTAATAAATNVKSGAVKKQNKENQRNQSSNASAENFPPLVAGAKRKSGKGKNNGKQ